MNKHKLLKYACYISGATMSVTANLPPLLFLTFHSLYDISFSLLGTLIVVNYITQLSIDLIFSFFSHKFNIAKTVKTIPFICTLGLILFALAPVIFENVYIGLLLGTIVFSVSSGLGEVLVSPVFATIPAKDPDREMSKLHSCYAWGTVAVIILATLFIFLFGGEKWQILVLISTIIPLLSAILFLASYIPKMETPKKTSDALLFLKNKSVWLSVIAIFLGGAAECNMSQWASSYLEQALKIPKIWGDIFGVALFALFLGLGRTLYGRFGKNVEKILFLGSIGATLCYLVAAIVPLPIIGLFACAFTGFCTSMLWPGNLVVSEKRFPQGGVFIYALMASGGDLGASVAPQLVGVITDTVISNEIFLSLSENLSLAPEQLGMKLGLLSGMLFPLLGIFIQYKIKKNASK